MNTRRSKRVADDGDDQLLLLPEPNTKRPRLPNYVWELLDDATKQDPKVAFAALARGLPVSKLPACIRKNRLSLLDAMKNKRLTWRQLSFEYKIDVDFGLVALENGDTDFWLILWWVTDKDKLWLEWACKHPARTHSDDWTRGKVPACVYTNPVLMRNVIREIPQAARIVAPSLAGNKDFVASLLEINPKTLAYFPSTTYDQYPKLVSLQASLNYFKANGSPCELEHAVPSTMWADQDFVLGWVSNYGEVLEDMSASIKNDKDVFRAVARNSSYQTYSFKHMSQGLKADKAFVLELCTLTDAVHFIHFINESLRFDEDVLIAVCARSPTSNAFGCSNYDDPYYEQELFENKVKAKMRAFEGFFKGILCGVTVKSGSESLQLLDQGDAAIPRHIASYLDFPVGKQLGQLIKAASNMKVVVGGFYPYEPDSM